MKLPPILRRAYGAVSWTLAWQVFIGVLTVSLALGADILEDLSSGERLTIWTLVVAVAIATILTPIVWKSWQDNHRRFGVYRLRPTPTIIVSGVPTKSAQVHQPRFEAEQFEKNAANALRRLLGIRNADPGYFLGVNEDGAENRAPETLPPNLIVLGGPVGNSVGHRLNESLLASEAYRGFCFFLDPTIEVVKFPEEAWTIVHGRATPGEFVGKVNYTDMPGTETSEGKSTNDYGFFYVGPNPLDPDGWLVWAAGIGPTGTYGPAKWLSSRDNLTVLANILQESGTYVSGLVRYKYIDIRDFNLDPELLALSYGRVPR